MSRAKKHLKFSNLSSGDLVTGKNDKRNLQFCLLTPIGEVLIPKLPSTRYSYRATDILLYVDSLTLTKKNIKRTEEMKASAKRASKISWRLDVLQTINKFYTPDVNQRLSSFITDFINTNRVVGGVFLTADLNKIWISEFDLMHFKIAT